MESPTDTGFNLDFDSIAICKKMHCETSHLNVIFVTVHGVLTLKNAKAEMFSFRPNSRKCFTRENKCHFFGFPTRCAVANIKATVSMSFG
jgi:hypothetical protein